MWAREVGLRLAYLVWNVELALFTPYSFDAINYSRLTNAAASEKEFEITPVIFAERGKLKPIHILLHNFPVQHGHINRRWMGSAATAGSVP
jgi:hypothetical protein